MDVGNSDQHDVSYVRKYGWVGYLGRFGSQNGATSDWLRIVAPSGVITCFCDQSAPHVRRLSNNYYFEDPTMVWQELDYRKTPSILYYIQNPPFGFQMTKK